MCASMLTRLLSNMKAIYRVGFFHWHIERACDVRGLWVGLYTIVAQFKFKYSIEWLTNRLKQQTNGTLVTNCVWLEYMKKKITHENTIGKLFWILFSLLVFSRFFFSFFVRPFENESNRFGRLFRKLSHFCCSQTIEFFRITIMASEKSSEKVSIFFTLTAQNCSRSHAIEILETTSDKFSIMFWKDKKFNTQSTRTYVSNRLRLRTHDYAIVYCITVVCILLFVCCYFRNLVLHDTTQVCTHCFIVDT